MERPTSSRQRIPLILALGVFATSFAVYTATAARTLCWGDSAEFAAVARTLGIAHPPGYPLYTLLSALAVRVPLGEPFLRLSVLSALFASGAAAVAVLVTWWGAGAMASAPPGTPRGVGPGATGVPTRAGDAPRAAGSVMAGFALAFAPTLWSQATVPEVYSLSAFLVLSAVLLVVLRERDAIAQAADRNVGGAERRASAERPVVLLGLVVGLALAHHLTAALAVPSLVAALAMTRPRPTARSAVLAVLLLVCGLLLYLYLPLRGYHEPAVLWAPVDTWRGALAHVTGAQYSSRLFAAPLVEIGRRSATFGALLPRELPWFVLAPAALGLVALWRRGRVLFVALVPMGLLTLAHAAVYQIPDIESYYIPAYAVLAVLAGCGLAWALASVPMRSLPARAAVGWVAVGAVVIAFAPHVTANWADRDLSEDGGGRVYCRRLLQSLRPNAIVVTMTDRVLFTLWYAQRVEERRPDVAVVCAREFAPQLERRLSGVHFPTEEELCRGFEGMTSISARPVRESVPIGNYLPLFVEANAGTRPMYFDPDIGRTLFADRVEPRGMLVELAVGPPDSVVAVGAARHGRLWERILSELAEGGVRANTVEVYAKTLAELALVQLARGEVSDSVTALETAVELAPHVTFCRNNLGVAYDRVGRYEDAVEQFERVLELSPGVAPTRFNLYRTSMKLGDVERAIDELEMAVRLDPRSARYRVELGTLLENEGDLVRAETMFETAARLSPEDWGARLAHGDFLARRRRYSEAVAAYERAEGLRPGSAGALEGLGRCYWALDDREQALEVMTRLVELQPHNPAPKYDLALMLHRTGRAREAVALLDDVTRLLPSMWEARALKASILGELGRHWEARALFEDAFELGASGDAFWSTWMFMERAAGDTMREKAVRARAERSSQAGDTARVGEGSSAGDSARAGDAPGDGEGTEATDAAGTADRPSEMVAD